MFYFMTLNTDLPTVVKQVGNIDLALTQMPVSKIYSWKFVMASEISFEFRIASLARKSFNRLRIHFYSNFSLEVNIFVLHFEANISKNSVIVPFILRLPFLLTSMASKRSTHSLASRQSSIDFPISKISQKCKISIPKI